VVFTAISLSMPHILLLDEPTNHLDMQSIDALCDAIEEFSGGVIVISHDSQLLSRLCADEERSQVSCRFGGGVGVGFFVWGGYGGGSVLLGCIRHQVQCAFGIWEWDAVVGPLPVLWQAPNAHTIQCLSPFVFTTKQHV
jgi:hypothetical protein